jgi:hypothetical protein
MGWGTLIGAGAGFFLGGPAGASLGASLGGSLEEVTGGGGGGAARDAARATAEATNRATELQRRMYDENVARQKPFYDVGVNALPELVEASKYRNFDMNQFQADPGYAFRLREGQQALDRQAAARGGLISGGALKAATRYGQEMGSQEYTNAFNRYQTENAARLNPLQSLTGMSQTTANTLGTAGQTMATNVGNAYINQGVNQGNALLAGSQARSSAYGNLAEAAGKFYEKYRGGSGTSGRWNPDTGTFG